MKIPNYSTNYLHIYVKKEEKKRKNYELNESTFFSSSLPLSLSLSLSLFLVFFFSLSPSVYKCTCLLLLIREFLPRALSLSMSFSTSIFLFFLFLATSCARFVSLSRHTVSGVFSRPLSCPPTLVLVLLCNLRRNIFSRNVRVHLLLS